MMKHAPTFRGLKACLAAGAALVALAAPSFAQTAAEPAAPAAVAAPEAAAPFAPALWVIRDADSTLYLYGTIHMRRPGEPWADDRVRTALASAQEVWTELEINAEAEAAIQPLVMQLGMTTPDRPLSSFLTPEQNERLGAALTKLGLPRNGLEPLKPWLAGITISVLSLVQAGYDPNSGVDRQVTAAAAANGSTARWFETAEEQLNFFATLPEAVQVEFLVDGVDELDEGVAMLNRMDAAWNVGDMAVLENDMIAQMRVEYPELYDVILTQRNVRWTETLTQELAGSGVDFVAVGAAHLVGPESVVAMLAERGIVAERVY
jgi:uncharacterized protein YbaP (TraB family)